MEGEDGNLFAMFGYLGYYRAGYAKPIDWINIKGEEIMRRKEKQHPSWKALMELGRGINFDTFSLIKNCRITFDIWR